MKYKVITDSFQGIEKGTEIESVDKDKDYITYSPVSDVFTAGKRFLELNSEWFQPVEEYSEGEYRFCSSNKDPYRINKKMPDGRYMILWLCPYDSDGTELVSKTSLDNDRELSKDEIESSLIKEAKRRGYRPNVKIKRGQHFSPNIEDTKLTSGYEPEYFPTNDSLDFCGARIYKQGQWAEVIEEPITINGYEADMAGGRICKVKIGCEDIDPSVFDNLSEYAQKYDLAIYREGEDITEQIKQIYEQL